MEDPLAIQIGYLTSTTLLGNNQSMAVAINNPTSYYDLVNGGTGGNTLDLPCCDAGDLVAFIRQHSGSERRRLSVNGFACGRLDFVFN